MEKKLMIFVDFDGTVARQDVCYDMVKKFARQGWAELNHLWEEGVLSTSECAQATLDLIEAQPQELEAFYQEMNIDPHFPAFLGWLKKNSFPVYILSDGYDNYIRSILKRHKIEIEYYANHLAYRHGWTIETPYLNPECSKCGVCKSSIIRAKLTPGCRSVYVGDGYSDLCPAGLCDILFAKDALADYCRWQGLSFYNYTGFDDVKNKLQEILSEKD